MAYKKSIRKSKIGIIISVIAIIILLAAYLLYYFNIPPFDFYIGDGSGKKGVVYTDGDLRIHFLDIGQGDSVLIELPDGKNMLIDAGKDNKETENKIIKYLEDKNISSVDYGLLTHSDADHCGGYDAVINSPNITFKTMYMPLLNASRSSDANQAVIKDRFDALAGNTDKATLLPSDSSFQRGNIQDITTAVYQKFVDATVSEGCTIVFSYQGQVIEGEGYSITFLNPSYSLYRKVSSAADKNNVSPIVILEFNSQKFMLTGDADNAAEQNSIAFAATNNINMDVDIIKIAHHGGKESSSKEFLDKAKPECAAICVGKNSYGHPTSEVLSRLKAIKCTVFTTQDKGTMVLTANGDKYSWKFEKSSGDFGSADEYDEETTAHVNTFKCIPTYSFNVVLRAA